MQPLILVVDVKRDLRLSARLVLNNYQYDVVEAESPEQALKILEDDPGVELVLLDMKPLLKDFAFNTVELFSIISSSYK